MIHLKATTASKTRHQKEVKQRIGRDFQTRTLLRMCRLYPGTPRYVMLLRVPAGRRQQLAKAEADRQARNMKQH